MRKVLFLAIALIFGAVSLVTVFHVPVYAAQSVTIRDDFFDLQEVSVLAGTMVTWQNAGMHPHTVTADNGSFDSGTLNTGAVFSQTFNIPGTYRYYCKLHGTTGGIGMYGVITVIADPNAPPPPPPVSPPPAVVPPPPPATTPPPPATSGTAVTPVITPGGGVALTSAVSVSMSTAQAGGQVYYTTNASTPSASSTRYTAPFTVNQTTTVKAVTVASGYSNSVVKVAQFSFSVAGDSEAPVISGISSQTGDTTATISWSTNEGADSAVEFGIGSLSDTSDLEPIPVTSHSIILTKLRSGTTYQFRVNSMDTSGNLGVSSTSSFTTSGSSSGQPPPAYIPPTTTPPPGSLPPPPPPTVNPPPPSPTNIVVPANSESGDVLQFSGNQTVYLVQDDGLHAFDTYDSFLEYKQVSGEQLQVVSGKPSSYTTNNTSAKVVLNQQSNSGSEPQYLTGTLANENGTIYFIENKDRVKVPFTNFPAFQGLGYSVKNLLSGDYSSYRVASTYWLERGDQEHPWGSWVLYTTSKERTVYYVTREGLIGVPSWETFLNNGGRQHLIVPINAADNRVWDQNRNLPVLQMNDDRVL